MITEVEARFWAKVEKTDGCWEWRGAISKNGYGKFAFGGTMKSVHRVAWVLTRGPIPEGLHVLHRCDNRPCVNPEHLWLGTSADNLNDCVVKGRFYCPQRKLSPEIAIEIRQLSHLGVKPLARRYGVLPSSIRLILQGKTYRYAKESVS
jgi:HNH endonuclease